MKKIKFLILFLITFIFGMINVYATTASLSLNASSIENGSSVKATVTVKSTAAWNITISSSGATSGCTQKFVGDSGTGKNTTQSFSVTCKATSQGIINFTISGDITGEKGNNVKVSDSKKVTVTPPRPKSTDNKLSSLSITDYDLMPVFSKDQNEYTVIVPSTVEKIKINAKKASSYASITGTGEYDVDIGTNLFEIIVTSETGISNVYKLTVNVEDLNPIEIKINNIKYTVVKEARNLIKPDLFDETTITINDIEIPAFNNDIINYTLIGLKDADGKISLFVYKEDDYVKYNEYISSRVSIALLGLDKELKHLKKDNIIINEESIPVYKNNDLVLIYGINIITGKKNYYKYDIEEQTIQIFDLDKYQEEINNQNYYKYLCYALSATTAILLFVTILQTINKKKSKTNKVSKNKKIKK